VAVVAGCAAGACDQRLVALAPRNEQAAETAPTMHTSLIGMGAEAVAGVGAEVAPATTGSGPAGGTGETSGRGCDSAAGGRNDAGTLASGSVDSSADVMVSMNGRYCDDFSQFHDAASAKRLSQSAVGAWRLSRIT